MIPDFQSVRRIGLFAAVGGTVWVGWVLLAATLPSPFVEPLVTLSATALVVALVGLHDLWDERWGRAGLWGVRVAAAGGVFVALAQAGLIVTSLLGVGFSAYLFLLVPGILGLVLGPAAVAVALARTGVVPPAVAAGVVVAAVAFLGFNTTDWRAILALPYGLAWVAVGYRLWTAETTVEVTEVDEAAEGEVAEVDGAAEAVEVAEVDATTDVVESAENTETVSPKVGESVAVESTESVEPVETDTVDAVEADDVGATGV